MSTCYLDLTLPTPADNLALDEALLLEAEAGNLGGVLRTWESPILAVVLGAGSVLAGDVDEAACRADGVPVLRRASGGGTVLIGPGCLCYSLVLDATLPQVSDPRRACLHIQTAVCTALRPLVGEAVILGSSDIGLGDRKFGGSAQRRLRRFLLFHGTVLYRFPIGLLARYLRPPRRQPAYRRQRGHEEFVINVPAEPESVKAALRSAWRADCPLADWPAARTAELSATKYEAQGWIRRR